MDELIRRVRETVAKLLSDEELAAFGVSNVPPDWGDDHQLWLIVGVQRQRFVMPLVPIPTVYVYETLDEVCERVYVTLGSWLAERSALQPI
jgi:hypothetical protein